jgi:gas vesicle protein
MCSEPVPRVTATLEAEGKGKASGQAPTPAVAAKAEAEGEGKVKSGGVTINEEVMVLFLREALYRLCEMSINLGSVEKEYKAPVLKLYTTVIEAAVNLSGKTDKTQSEQIRARTLEKYIDFLAQYQKATNDATAASSQSAQVLKGQVDEIRTLLTQSVNEIKGELASLKSSAAQPIPVDPAKVSCSDGKC